MLEYRHYDRKKLYEEVWKEPVLTVAKRYGVSDVALAKVCRSLDVPLPGHGYWAQIRAGQKLKKPPLGANKGRTEINSPVFEYSDPKKTVIDTSLLFLDDEQREKIIDSCKALQVKTELRNPHTLIQSTKQWMKSGGVYDSNYGPFFRYRLSDKSRTRAFLILDSIFKELEKHGYQVVTKHPILNERSHYGEGEKHHLAHVVHGNVYVTLNIKDRMHPKPKEIEPVSKASNRRKNEPVLEPKEVFEYSGELTFWIGSAYSRYKTWNDSKTYKLEDKLGEIVISIIEAIHKAEVDRIERLRKEEEARIRAEEEAAFKERQRKEVKKVRQLLADAENYQASAIVFEYLRALGGYGDTDNHAMHKYIEWAKDKATWMNPLNNKDDELLGKLDAGIKEFLGDDKWFNRRW